ARQGFWARLRERGRSVRPAPALGGLAVVAVVVVFGGLLLARPPPTGSTTRGTAAAPAVRNGAAGADQGAQRFGPLPRPALRSPAPTASQGAAPSAASGAQYAGPVTVTAVTATVNLP